MAGYSKLDCGIVDSSLWEMPHEYLRVWIAMLAKTDATGYVRVAAPAMARLCHLTREDFDRVIDTFTSPDPESRTPDHEGCRLEKVDGGWLILNYLKYREGLKQPDHSTNRVKKHREKQKECNGSTVSETDETICNAYAEAEAKADAKAKAIKKKPPKSPKGDDSNKLHHTGLPLDALWKESFEDFWDIYPKKRGKETANKAWDKLKGDEHLYCDICNAVIAWSQTEDWLKNDGQFVPNASTFLNQKRWQDEIPAAKPIDRTDPKWMAENDDYTAIGGTKGATDEEYDALAAIYGWYDKDRTDE